jgi:hypothetical protein
LVPAARKIKSLVLQGIYRQVPAIADCRQAASSVKFRCVRNALPPAPSQTKATDMHRLTCPQADDRRRLPPLCYRRTFDTRKRVGAGAKRPKLTIRMRLAPFAINFGAS